MKNTKLRVVIFIIILLSFKCDDLIDDEEIIKEDKSKKQEKIINGANIANITDDNISKINKSIENGKKNKDNIDEKNESFESLKSTIEKDLQKIIFNNNSKISELSLLEDNKTSEINSNKSNIISNNSIKNSVEHKKDINKMFRFTEKSSEILKNQVSSSFSSNNNNTPTNAINGSIVINGQKYIAVCDCGENAKDSNLTKSSNGRSEVNSSACDPSKIKISTEMTGYGANINQIKDLVGNLDDLEFVKIEEEAFNCLDGRNKNKGIATPGADAGEFILALDVYENLLPNGKKLDKELVNILFKSYLKFMKPAKFRMCTDNKAIEFIKTEIQAEGFNLENPRPQLKNDIEKLLVKSETMGDLHLKLMTRYQAKYMIRKELIEYFILSFYNLLWDKTSDLRDKLDLNVLNGDHMEAAFVEVRTEKECQREKIAPLISNFSKESDLNIFVNHIDGVKIRRKQLAEFFSDRRNHSQDEVDVGKMYNRLLHHGNAFLNIFGTFAAKGLPFYSILLS